jgi:hypothetical protein
MLRPYRQTALAAAFAAPGEAAAQPQGATFYAAPAGRGTQCTKRHPFAPQDAVMHCPAPAVSGCLINLADGVYADPAINISYYRAVHINGNCQAPRKVVLRVANKPAALITVQDHAIGIVSCLTVEATVDGATAILGRRHVIVDYVNIVFGADAQGHACFHDRILHRQLRGQCLARRGCPRARCRQ